MLTFFTTAKKFMGHVGTIQRNALKSWTLLGPEVDAILFGDDEGASDAARDLGIRHEPYTEKNEFGSKRLDYLFLKAQAMSKHDLLCYCNCDIILTSDFFQALEHARATLGEFLMVGRRWDTDIREPLDFSAADWESQVRRRALLANCQRNAWYIDYFAFSKGLYGREFPPLVVGRIYWDNWTIWKALASRKAVLDASHAVLAIHQNHDYGYHPLGKQGVWGDQQTRRNYELAGGFRHLRSIESATHRFTDSGIQANFWHWYPHCRETLKHYRTRGGEIALHAWRNTIWYPLLDLTRPVRSALGFRAHRLRAKSKPSD